MRSRCKGRAIECQKTQGGCGARRPSAAAPLLRSPWHVAAACLFPLSVPRIKAGSRVYKGQTVCLTASQLRPAGRPLQRHVAPHLQQLPRAARRRRARGQVCVRAGRWVGASAAVSAQGDTVPSQPALPLRRTLHLSEPPSPTRTPAGVGRRLRWAAQNSMRRRISAGPCGMACALPGTLCSATSSPLRRSAAAVCSTAALLTTARRPCVVQGGARQGA